jgi:Holliday junction resolvase-like predicted endonuclease
MDSKHKGAHSELVACAWLLRQGYEVFRNISDRGIIDIIAIKGT